MTVSLLWVSLRKKVRENVSNGGTTEDPKIKLGCLVGIVL